MALDLVPSTGGKVASFRVDGIDLMRPMSPTDPASGNMLGVALFPMLPYANSIA